MVRGCGVGQSTAYKGNIPETKSTHRHLNSAVSKLAFAEDGIMMVLHPDARQVVLVVFSP